MALRFFETLNTKQDVFAPEIHKFLVEANGLYLFPMKDTDKWTGLPAGYLLDFKEVPKDKVPIEVRRKAGQRLGAYRRHNKKR